MADHSTLFFLVAGFAVFFVALAKAGFGGMVGSLAMPLVAAVSDIPTAISVLLPTYVVMDVIVAWLYRKHVPFRFLWPMAAAGLAGVLIGAVVFRAVNTSYLAILLGMVSLLMGLRFFRDRHRGTDTTRPTQDAARPHWGRLIGLNGASGFGSFFLMGEAPFQMFLVPFRFAPQVYVAIAVWFFFIVNWAKMPIVLGMGLVTTETLWVSALLLPIMPLGIAFGKYINTRLPKEPYYVVVHILLVLLGTYLILNAMAEIRAGTPLRAF